MPYCFIISSRKNFYKGLGLIIRNKTLYEPVEISIPLEPENNENLRAANYENPVPLFHALEDKIASCTAEALRHSVVLVDELISPYYLDPLSNRENSQQFYGMLLLAFPELQFSFLNTKGLPHAKFHLLDWLDSARKDDGAKKYSTHADENYQARVKAFGKYHDCQLFDPHGIRETIKTNITLHPEHQYTAPYFPERKYLALSIEDEENYSLFNAYAAFKAGYKCKVIDSLAHLQNLQDEIKENTDYSKRLKKHREKQQYKKDEETLPHNDFEIKVLFEDLYLNFYDRTGTEENISNLKVRDEKYPFLKHRPLRNLVSVAHENRHYKTNQTYIQCLKHCDTVHVNEINKPGKGLYYLLKEGGLLKSYRHKKERWIENAHPRKADNPKAQGSHSTPGILLIIAESLLKRADRILNGTNSVADAIHAATLATEARELLGTRTPTVALQALMLQQRAEVTAESLFFGVEYGLSLKERFRDIDDETRAISKWFRKNKQGNQHLNAYLSIVEQLAKEFSNRNQFEEELDCLDKARYLKFKIWRKRKWSFRWGTPLSKIKYLVKPVHWYIQLALNSILSFIGLILLLVFLFAISYFFIAICGGHCVTFGDAFFASAKYFFAFESAEGWSLILSENWVGKSVVLIQSVLAFSHLALLVTHIYLRLLRR